LRDNKTVVIMEKSGWMVIVNPKAGNGKGLSDWPLISNTMNRSNLEFTCQFTEHKYHTVELTVKAIKDGYRKIIGVGGDGTLNEIVNGIFLQKEIPSQDITIGVIPTGAGNDRARGAGLTYGYSQAIKSLAVCETQLQDSGVAEYFESGVKHVRYMINAAGVGFDADVNAKYNWFKEEGKRGKWRFVQSFTRSLFRYRTKRFTIKANGLRVYKAKLFLATLGIGPYSGGGIISVPDSKFDDSLFDVTIVKMMPRIFMYGFIRDLRRGKVKENKRLVRIRASEVEISSNPPSIIEIDGEALGMLPAKFSILPLALRFVTLRQDPHLPQ